MPKIMYTAILAIIVFLFAWTQTFVKTASGFETQGSLRVPTVVKRDRNLRDLQPVNARIVAVDTAYTEHNVGQAGQVCGHEQFPINDTDNRNFLQKILFPRGPVHHETQYNCYQTQAVAKQQVFAGYMVTYELYGRLHHTLVHRRPTGRYIRVLIK
tara:strand:- start:57 stop:524 length:468 start_codon:yes stop_codon:yes gene_type:complete